MIAHEHLVDLLDLCPTAAMLLDRMGQVVFANRAARFMVQRGPVLVERKGLVTARRAEEATTFAAALEQASASAKPVTVTFHSREGFAVCAVSLRRAEGSDLVMAIASDLRHAADLSPQQLRRVFGFTPAESIVAIRLAAGGTLVDVASSLGISVNTVRGHMRALLASAPSM